MKTVQRRILVLLFILPWMATICLSQNLQLWGMTFQGGNTNSGVLFRVFANGNGFQNLHNFETTTGNFPKGNLININGNIYGMTDSGGLKGGGVIFKFDPTFNIYSVLYNFDTARTNVGVLSGKYPSGSLIYVGNNLIYGMTNAGGVNKKGVIFKFDLATGIYSKVYDFDGTNGQYPSGNLIIATDGKLYGMTPLGGQYTDGVIFSFDMSTNTFNKLWDFNGGDGANPRGSLTQALNGNLYGMTYGGGDSSRGVMFTINPINSSYGTIFTFHGINGAYPYNSLYQANDLKLYGAILSNPNGYNSGSIFSHNLNSNLHVDVLSFPAHDFGRTFGNVFQATDGLLYGMTNRCGHDSTIGSDSSGVIFSLNITNNSCSVIHVFDSVGGAFPYGDLIEMPANTGVFENTKEPVSVSVFPNPSTNEVSFIVENGEDSEYSLKIYNLMGQEVFVTGEFKFGVKVDLSKFVKGMYFYQVFDKQKAIAIGKLIKD